MSIAFLKRIKFLKKKKYKPVSIEIISKNIIKLNGFLGSNTLKTSIFSFFEQKKNIYIFKVSNLNTFKKLFFYTFLGVSYGWFITLEVSGRGYFIYTQNNIGFFNFGHSHGICYFFLDEKIMSYDKKRKTYFNLYGIDLVRLYNFAIALKKLRPLSVYKGKGVKFENEIIKLKPGKQGNF